MKKATIIAALLIALMLLVSCGGNDPSNPADTTGGKDELAGMKFNAWVWDTTWDFGTDGTVRYTVESQTNPIDVTYNYTIDSSKKILTLHERDAQGNSIGKARLKKYSLDMGGDYLNIEDAIPDGISYDNLYSNYWCPEFTTANSTSWDEKNLKIYGEDDLVFYRNEVIDSQLSECKYDITAVTATSITATKSTSQIGYNWTPYPPDITITYTTSGNGEDMKINTTVPVVLELTWNTHSMNLERVQN